MPQEHFTADFQFDFTYKHTAVLLFFSQLFEVSCSSLQSLLFTYFGSGKHCLRLEATNPINGWKMFVCAFFRLR